MKIAIKFRDNDFHSTFRGVLAVLFDAYKYDTLPTDKVKLCWMINSLSPIIYVTHQNQWKSNDLQIGLVENTNTNRGFERMKSYLQITLESIFIDDEVDNLISSGDSDVYILDTKLYSNNIYSI